MTITVISKMPSSEDANVRLGAAVQLLRAEGQDVRVCVTGSPARARVLAREASEAGSDLVVAAGGDGTVNQVVNGLFASARTAPLGVLPLGSANNFAAGLGIPEDAEQAARVLLDGFEREIDVARVNGCCFVNVSTGGSATEAARPVDGESKGVFGPIAYLMHGAMALVHLESLQARFVLDGSVVHAGELYFFAVGNLRQTGAGLPLASNADVRDRKLDVLIVPKVTRLDVIALLPELRRGPDVSPDVIHLEGESLVLETDQEITVHADGEPVLGQNFHYGIHPRTLRVKTQAAA